MNKKLLFTLGGLVVVGGVVYLYLQNKRRVKETEELKKSVQQLTEKYKVFN